MTAIAAAALAAGVWVWFLASTFVPLAADGRPLEYVFVGAPYWLLPAGAATVAAALAPMARRRGSASFAWPLVLLAAAPAAALALLPAVQPYGAVVLYLLVDLRPWWTAALIVWALLRAGIRPSLPESPRVASALLFAGLILWVTATTPHLRFDASLHGDEPKYLRFCENWYQGKGLDVGQVQTMAELGPGFTPPLARNVGLLADAIGEDLRFAAADLRMLATDGLRARFNRAEYAQAWIVRGRNGGYYQLHNPGLSALLFPAYFIDRHFIASTPGYQGVFPDRLYATNVMVAAIWAAWGVAVFALLRAATGRPRVAWATAALAMMTMPMAAFGFQIYPEAAAGAIVCAVLAWTLTRAPVDSRVLTALAAGVAAGFLPWLHVRLIVLSLVLAGWAALRARRGRVVLAGYVVMIAALCAYAYHISGSLRPDAMYAAQGAESAWIPAEARQSVISIPFDRIWGFLPHAPVYLLAIPGWLLMARRAPAIAGGVLLLIAALAVPVAGHGFTAAGATPLRQLSAVVPLLLLPVSEAVARWKAARTAQVAIAILAVLSLDTALSYNLGHLKHVGRHVDAGFSGWAPNLLFPWTHGDLWAAHRGTFLLFLAWVAICAALVMVPWLRATPRSQMRAAPAVVGGLIVFLIVATGASALGGEMTRTDYLVAHEEAQRIAVTAAVAQDRCRLCVSSTRGPVGRSTIVSATDQRMTVDPPPDLLTAGSDVRIRVRLLSSDGIGWGTVAADFGDGTTNRETAAGGTVLTHRYPRPGRYHVVIRFDPATGPPTQQSLELTVR